MKETACEQCPFKIMGFSECPNYIETLWHKEGELQPQIIRDCAPKRTLLMLQELYNRTFALQQQVGQFENVTEKMKAEVKRLIHAICMIRGESELEETKVREIDASGRTQDHD